MPNEVLLTDMLNGITDSYESPPWALADLRAQHHGSVVVLLHDDGSRRTIPVKINPQQLSASFEGWPRPSRKTGRS